MRKLTQHISRCLKQGLRSEEIALAVAFGIAIGVFPIYGLTSVLCLGVAWVMRWNGPILFAGAYTMTLIKPLLILPFLRLGEWVFRVDPMPISLVELSRRFAETPLDTLGEFAWSFLHALAGWLVVLPILIPLLYRVCLVLVERLSPTPSDRPSPTPGPRRTWALDGQFGTEQKSLRFHTRSRKESSAAFSIPG